MPRRRRNVDNTPRNNPNLILRMDYDSDLAYTAALIASAQEERDRAESRTTEEQERYYGLDLAQEGYSSPANTYSAIPISPEVRVEVATPNQPSVVDCHYCDRAVNEPIADLTEINGHLYCESCVETQFYYCNSCEEYFFCREYQSHNVGGDTLCAECFDDNYSFCDDCSNVTDNNNINSVEGGDRHVCNRCYENYRECGECGYLGNSEGMDFCDNCESYYCGGCNCGCNGEQRRGGVNLRQQFSERNVSTTPLVGVVSDKIHYPRLVGLEIEAEDGECSKLATQLPPNFGVSHDGSIQRGLEIQTPPASWEELARCVEIPVKLLKKNEFKISSRCGLHIHLDASDFKRAPVKIAKILKTYYAIENLIYQMVPLSRRQGRFCLPLQGSFDYTDFTVKKMGELESNWYQKANAPYWKNKSSIREWQGYGKDSVRKMKREKYCESRYLGVNLHSIFFRGTLELRHHSGTLNKTKIFHWINFNLSIVDYALKHFKEAEVIQLLEMAPRKEKFLAAAKIFGWKRDLTNYLLMRASKFNHGKLMKEDD